MSPTLPPLLDDGDDDSKIENNHLGPAWSPTSPPLLEREPFRSFFPQEPVRTIRPEGWWSLVVMAVEDNDEDLVVVDDDDYCC